MGGEVPHISLPLMKTMKKSRGEKNLFTIRLKSCFLTPTSKKINLGTGNAVYQPFLSAVLDPPPHKSHYVV